MHIQRLELTNFKSFKKATIPFKEGFNAIVGPNGSGKSNVSDAVRFALGEKRLSALRVRSAKQLIHRGSSHGRVKLVLKDGEEEHVIERAIRSDGKVVLKLNGRSIRLSALKDFLRRHGIDNLDRIVISQGQVDKIALLKPKDLRSFIEELAGIAEYERKKEEALKELEVVERRIREANIALGEKLSLLEELEKEKERLEAYRRLKERLDSLRYSIAYHQAKEVERKVDVLSQKLAQLREERAKLVEELKRVEGRERAIMEERKSLQSYVDEQLKGDEAYRRLEELEKSVAVKREKLRHLLEEEQRLKEEMKALLKERDELEEAMSKERDEAQALERKAKRIKVEEVRVDEAFYRLEAKVGKLREELARVKAERAKVEERVKLLRERLRDLEERLQSYKGREEERKALQEELKRIEREIVATFKEESRLQREMAEVDKRFLKIKERMAELAAHRKRGSSVLEYLKEFAKAKGLKVYGAVIDLIDFDEELAEAVEAAGGGRLSHIVVEDIETAKKCIAFLKRQKLGRATFVPLKEVVVREAESEKALANFVRAEPGFEKVLAYAFGDTLLFNSLEEASPYIGRARLVTIDGTLVEPNVVLTGGAKKGSITAAKLLASLQRELEELRERKRALEEEVRRIREKAVALKEERAKLQVMIKEEPKEDVEPLYQQTLRELEEAEKALLELQKREVALSQELERAEEAYREKRREVEALLKEGQERALEKASLKAKLIERAKALLSSASEKEVKLREVEARLQEVQRKMEELEGSIRALEDEIGIEEGELTMLREEYERAHQALKEHMERMKAFEEELQELGLKHGSLSNKLRKVERAMQGIEVELSGLKAKLEFLREEVEKGKGSLVEGPIHKLEEEMREVEAKLQEMGNINFAVEEMMEQIGAKVREVKERIETLKREKEKILELIRRIEEKKKSLFLETFEKVKAKFEELTAMLPNFGRATLYLTSGDVMEAGVGVRLIRDVPVPLESLSGGEKSLLSIMFLFAMQAISPSPIYIMDEVDAALDKLNSKRLGEFIKAYSRNAQFIVISHNDITISFADAVIGVSKQGSTSTAVALSLEEVVARA